MLGFFRPYYLLVYVLSLLFSTMVLLTWWYVVIMVRLMLGGYDLMRALGVQWLVCCSRFLVD